MKFSLILSEIIGLQETIKKKKNSSTAEYIAQSAGRLGGLNNYNTCFTG